MAIDPIANPNFGGTFDMLQMPEKGTPESLTGEAIGKVVPSVLILVAFKTIRSG
jgi:hypothetical protein